MNINENLLNDLKKFSSDVKVIENPKEDLNGLYEHLVTYLVYNSALSLEQREAAKTRLDNVMHIVNKSVSFVNQIDNLK